MDFAPTILLSYVYTRLRNCKCLKNNLFNLTYALFSLRSETNAGKA
ncbi:hypothetical protein HMPREF9148_01256 [Prevotella sp. F0091]|nr:hypothetical protein HMPREF9148_01256 [Prevotella sp. F0091]